MDVTGSLQIKSNHYYVVYRIDGGNLKWKSTKIPKGKNKSDKSKNKRLAEEFKNNFFALLEKSSGKNQEKKPEKFSDFLLIWLSDHRNKVKESTWNEYNRAITNLIEPYFKQLNKYLSEVVPKDIESFYVFLKEDRHLSKKSIKNYRSILSKAVRYAYVNDMIDKNPVEKAEMPSFDFNEEFNPTIYSVDQMRTLLEFADESDPQTKIFLYLLSVTGARKGEILGLTWDDIDFDAGIISFNHSMTQPRAKSSKELSTLKTRNSYRSCFLPAKVVDLLKNERIRQNKMRTMLGCDYTTYKYDFIIRQDDGKIYNNPRYINRKVNKLMKKAGLPHCRIHDIRHFVATLLFDNNVPINQITAQLGHGDTTTTERIYIHRSQIANKENARLIEQSII